MTGLVRRLRSRLRMRPDVTEALRASVLATEKYLAHRADFGSREAIDTAYLPAVIQAHEHARDVLGGKAIL